MAAFLRKNEFGHHRLGVTASTKAVGKSVDRNRARRLLREVFRRSGGELSGLRRHYDWVINAKRSLLSSNEELRFREFRRIVEQVARDEKRVDRRLGTRLSLAELSATQLTACQSAATSKRCVLF